MSASLRGSRSGAHVHWERLRVADRRHCPGLEDAKQERLTVQRQFSHLVEEEDAVVGRTEQARGIADRTGEGAPGVAKQTRSGQVSAEGSAVEGLERAGLG